MYVPARLGVQVHSRALVWLFMFMLICMTCALVWPQHASATPVCADNPMSTAFSAHASSETVSSATDIDCYTLQDVSAGQLVLASLRRNTGGGSPQWDIRNGSGTTICSGSTNRSTCTLTGAAGWTFRVYNAGTGTFGFSAAVNRLSGPAGCTALDTPSVWSMSSPRIDGTIEQARDTDCFTFSRILGEADARYSFRTVSTSGTINPTWTLYSQNGGSICSGSSNYLTGCSVAAIGNFVLIVDEWNSETGVGSYGLTVDRLNARTGCGDLATIAYGTAPTSGSISASGEVDCFTIPNVAAGDWIDVAQTMTLSNSGSPYWSVVDGGGSIVCSSYFSGSNSTCQLSGIGDWALMIHDYDTGTFSYDVAVRRRTNPQGCSALTTPDDYSFTAARKNGSIGDRLEADCFTFSRGVGEVDAKYFPRAIHSSGTLNPVWSIVGPTGSDICSGSPGNFVPCSITGSGQFAFVVRDSSRTQTGAYFATLPRSSSPIGCTALGSVEFGSDAASGQISQASETDCFTIPNVSAGQTVDVAFASVSGGGSPRWTMVDGNGTVVCTNYYSSQDTCELTGAAGWTLLVNDYDAGAFSYNLAARRLSNPTGCSALDAQTWSFATPRTEGSITATLDSDCFTFTRAPGDPDSTYWLRTLRSSGQLNPRWTVFGPSGDQECAGTAGYYTRCQLLASGSYTVLVRDSNETSTGSYFMTGKRANQPAGCSPLASTAFGAAATSQSISTGGEIDCFSIPGSAVDDVVEVAFRASTGSNPQPQWSVIDGNGSEVCSSRSGDSTQCHLDGASGWSVIVYDYGTGTFPYSLAVRNLKAPQGCSALSSPSALAYTAPRINGSLDAALDADCYTFTRTALEGDGSYWMRALRTSGSNTPRWGVYGPDGFSECNGTNGYLTRCQLVDSGTFTLVVRDQSLTGTGSYAATAKRLNSPQGCSGMSSVAFGLPSTAGNVSSGGEIDCYSFPGSAGDQLRFTKTGVIDGLAVVNPSGEYICDINNTTCTLDETGQYTVLAYLRSATTTGSYTFSAACQNVPCGESQTAIADLVPNRVGASEYVTTTIRGHDLNLLSSVQITRGATTVPGDLQDPSADGRAVDVRFDLAGAPTGAWEMTGQFLDGTTRVLASALTVESLKPANAKVELIAREVFRINQPTEVSIAVSNSGNVDAVGVPVTIRGIPAGSEVESVTQIWEPQGSAGNVDPQPTTLSMDDDMYADSDGSLVLPMIATRVPAGKTVRLELKITVHQASNYVLSAAAAACLVNTAQSVTVFRAGRADPGVDCATSMASSGIDLATAAAGTIPGAACVSTAGSIAAAGIGDAAGGEDWYTGSNLLGWAIGSADCVTDFVPGIGTAKAVISAASVVSTAVGVVDTLDTCAYATSNSELMQRAVTSIDPNEIIGPTGSGAQRYIAADTPLDYKILFENLPAASAPAQRIRITNQLSLTTFQPATVLFNEVRFGTTSYALSYPSHEIDQTIDLRPAKNMLVHITASITNAGLLTAEMQALDPETLGPPADPLSGILPPNVTSPEGEGFIAYSVAPKTLAPGAQINNQASIVFDDNAAIETPVWTNVVDKAAPQPTVSVAPGASSAAAAVTWTGTDDASGIERYDVFVSKDNGAFELWRLSGSPDTAAYTATQTGSYRFRVVARDGAGNVGQSSQVTIGLDSSVTTVPPGTGGGGGGGGGGGAALPLGSAAAAAAPVVEGATAKLKLKLAGNGTIKFPFKLACPGTGSACGSELAVHLGGSATGKTKLGVAKSTIASGASGAASIKLSAKARKRFKRGKANAVTIVVTLTRDGQKVTKTIKGSVKTGK